MLAQLLEPFALLLVLRELFKVLHSDLFSQFNTFFGKWLNVKLEREQTFGMNFGVSIEI